MPKYTDPSTGKVIRSDVPLDPDELEEAFVLSSKQVSPVNSSEESDFPKLSGFEQAIGNFITGTVRGVTNVAEGLKQRDIEARRFIGISPREVEIANTQEQELLKQRKEREPLPSDIPTKVGTTFGETLPFLAIPSGAGGRLLHRVLVQGATGAGIGWSQPTESSDEVTKNMLLGGITGGASTVAIAPLGKAINAAKGVFPRAYDEILALSKKYKIPLSLGEIKNNPIIQKAETWLEAIPVLGINGFRIKQNVMAENAGKSLLSKYIANPNADDIATANRDYVKAMYNELTEYLDYYKTYQPGSEFVVPKKLQESAKALLGRFPDIFKKFQDTKMESMLQDIIAGTSKTVGISQATVGKTAARPTFEQMWMLRGELGSMIGQARKKLASGEINHTEYSQLSNLFGSVSDDMETWALKKGRVEFQDAFTAANDSYKNYVVKYNIMQEAMDKAEGIIGAGEIFSPKKMSTILKDIVHKQKRGDANLFSADEIKEMTGLIKLMQIAKRGGQFMENPPTGNRWGIPQMVSVGLGVPAGVAMGGSPASAAIMIGGEMGVAGLGTFLTTNPVGKALMLATSELQPNSPEMLRIIYDVIPKAMSGATVETGKDKKIRTLDDVMKQYHAMP